MNFDNALLTFDKICETLTSFVMFLNRFVELLLLVLNFDLGLLSFDLLCRTLTRFVEL